LPRLDDLWTLPPPRLELARALLGLPPPPLAALGRWPPGRATARSPPLCAIALVRLLLRLAAPRTLCLFTARAGVRERVWPRSPVCPGVLAPASPPRLAGGLRAATAGVRALLRRPPPRSLLAASLARRPAV
jgi:hypothetical protein